MVKVGKLGLSGLMLAGVLVPGAVVGVDVAEASTPSPERDFTVKDVSGGVEVSKYTGSSSRVVIPSTIGDKQVVSIGYSAIRGSEVEVLEIPEGVKGISNGAITQNEKLKTVKLPSTFEKVLTTSSSGVVYSPITGNKNLENIEVEEGNQYFKSIRGSLYSKDGEVLYAGVTEGGGLRVGEGTKKVLNLAGSDIGITKLTLPEGLEVIEGHAFSKNKIKSVSIPKSVVKVEGGAFQENELTDVEVKGADTVLEVSVHNGNRFSLFGQNQENPTNLTIWGKDPSTAKNHAQEFGFTFNEGELEEEEGGTGGESGTRNSQDVTVNLTGGDLTLTSPEIRTFGDVVLGGKVQVVETGFTDVFTVTDARGTGEGWRLDVSATQFSIKEPEGGFKAGTGSYSLPEGSLTLSSLESIVREGGSSVGGDPVKVLTEGLTIDGGGTTVSRAEVGEGEGTFDLTFGEESLSLVLDPVTAQVDKVNYPDGSTPYESTLSWDLVSAP